MSGKMPLKLTIRMGQATQVSCLSHSSCQAIGVADELCRGCGNFTSAGLGYVQRPGDGQRVGGGQLFNGYFYKITAVALSGKSGQWRLAGYTLAGARSRSRVAVVLPLPYADDYQRNNQDRPCYRGNLVKVAVK